MSIEDEGSETLPSETQPTAVVVEDDQIIVTLLEHLLSRRGFEVRIATDGRQAIDFLDTLPSPPALVLLDVMLPYLDGFEIIKRIREHATWNQVPIIMLTAKS